MQNRGWEAKLCDRANIAGVDFTMFCCCKEKEESNPDPWVAEAADRELAGGGARLCLWLESPTPTPMRDGGLKWGILWSFGQRRPTFCWYSTKGLRNGVMEGQPPPCPDPVATFHPLPVLDTPKYGECAVVMGGGVMDTPCHVH